MENIEVVLRIRPPNLKELEVNDIDVWEAQSSETIGMPKDKY